MSAISPRFCRPVAPTLSVDDNGGNGLPVIFQHGVWGDAHQTIEAFPSDPRFRRITVESRGHGSSEAGDPRVFSIRTLPAGTPGFIITLHPGPSIIGRFSERA